MRICPGVSSSLPEATSFSTLRYPRCAFDSSSSCNSFLANPEARLRYLQPSRFPFFISGMERSETRACRYDRSIVLPHMMIAIILLIHPAPRYEAQKLCQY